MNIPVAIIIYNRYLYLEKLITKLNDFKISKVYIIADGPKKNNENDKQFVKKTRLLVEKKLKSKKKIKIYSNKNLGLRKRVISGLDMVFKMEKKIIILEDDCIPSKDFFKFMSIMLKKYEEDFKIASICGSNHLSYWPMINNSYIYSKYFNSWGWATWNSRWKSNKLNASKLYKNPKSKFLKNYLDSWRASIFWKLKLKAISSKKLDSWAMLWNYFNFLKNKKHIIPKKNLIENIGLGKLSTNTKSLPYKYISADKLNKIKIFPLKNKISKKEYDEYDKSVEDIVFSKNILNRMNWLIYKFKLLSK